MVMSMRSDDRVTIGCNQSPINPALAGPRVRRHRAK